MSKDGRLEALISCEILRPAQSEIQVRTTNSSLKFARESYSEAVGTKRKHARLGNVRNVRARREAIQADGLSADAQAPHAESFRSGDGDGAQDS